MFTISTRLGSINLVKINVTYLDQHLIKHGRQPELLNTFFQSLACPFASTTYWQEPLVLVLKYSQAQPRE